MLTDISLSPLPQWNAAAFYHLLILVELFSFPSQQFRDCSWKCCWDHILCWRPIESNVQSKTKSKSLRKAEVSSWRIKFLLKISRIKLKATQSSRSFSGSPQGIVSSPCYPTLSFPHNSSRIAEGFTWQCSVHPQPQWKADIELTRIAWTSVK